MTRDAAKTALFAGGIGVTPLLAMAGQLAADRANFVPRYRARSGAHAAFLDRLDAYGVNVVNMHFDDGSAAQKLDIEATLATLRDAHVYVCGPPMRHARIGSRNPTAMDQSLLELD